MFDRVERAAMAKMKAELVKQVRDEVAIELATLNVTRAHVHRLLDDLRAELVRIPPQYVPQTTKGRIGMLMAKVYVSCGPMPMKDVIAAVRDLRAFLDEPYSGMRTPPTQPEKANP